MAIGKVLTLTTVSCALLVHSAPARACGGCFHPPPQTSTPSVVTGHRMAFAVSATRTVLWDQIQYSGSPSDFAWVLPVRAGAYLETSTDAWFEALEAVTATRVTSPELVCAGSSSSGGGAGCASDQSSSGLSSSNSTTLPTSANSTTSENSVVVVHQGTVGPYETVTLHSQSGGDLRTWLTANGYTVPWNVDPIIDAYVAEGWDFIALRLRPGVGVQQMTPVRVVTPGGAYALPLRMVAAGAGESVGIVLYVIAEGRYAMPDLSEVSVDPLELTWDFKARDSNYSKLRSDSLFRNARRSYLTGFAFERPFGRTYSSPTLSTLSYSVQGSGTYTTFMRLYFAQADYNQKKPIGSCLSVGQALDAPELVVSGAASSGEISDSALECDGHTDLAAALTGMHPNQVWATRLEMELPREALNADCVVAPSSSQASVDNQLQATKQVNRPANCPEPIFQSRIARARAVSRKLPLWLLALFGALAVLRRSRRGSGG
ncbi:MAG TPA: DUF2330 domain-containing protein [Polyangiaceae bacterium]